MRVTAIHQVKWGSNETKIAFYVEKTKARLFFPGVGNVEDKNTPYKSDSFIQLVWYVTVVNIFPPLRHKRKSLQSANGESRASPKKNVWRRRTRSITHHKDETWGNAMEMGCCTVPTTGILKNLCTLFSMSMTKIFSHSFARLAISPIERIFQHPCILAENWFLLSYM